MVLASRTVPITHGVSPPSVDTIYKSSWVKPNSLKCYAPNSGWSSKSSTDLIIAISPPVIKETTFSEYSGIFNYLTLSL